MTIQACYHYTSQNASQYQAKVTTSHTQTPLSYKVYLDKRYKQHSTTAITSKHKKHHTCTHQTNIRYIFSLISISVDGDWSPWSFWSKCDADCGTGKMQRKRRCDSPAPIHGGLICSGASVYNDADVEIIPCFLKECKAKKTTLSPKNENVDGVTIATGKHFCRKRDVFKIKY